MGRERLQKQKILIVDDSEINRSILADILGEEYEIMEAEDGVQALALIQKHVMDISIVLLDIVMPHMDGFGVLTVMNQNHWIDNIPVIMISAENNPAYVGRAYELGVTDFITRPFDALIVHRRVVNTVLLYMKQKKLVSLVAAQIDEKERHSSMMVDILSHLVEFRNGESSAHIVHVRFLTEILLRQLQRKTDRYRLTQAEISVISTASALHDIGKIAIDEKILNKPGRLTPEEFEIMKTHTLLGAEMLENLPEHQEEPLVKTAYEICRWHHERYGGRGYPDGLVGDEIPISAQVVALADVYDALTSDRCYKKAIPHKEAVRMIVDGECGEFGPLLLECLRDVEDVLEAEFAGEQLKKKRLARTSLTRNLVHGEMLFASERSLYLLDRERMKYNFFFSMAEEIQFEYAAEADMLSLSSWGAEKLGLDEVIMDPGHNEAVNRILGEHTWEKIAEALRRTTVERPLVNYECQFLLNGQPRWHRIIIQAIWTGDSPPQCTGAIGKAVDIHDSRVKMEELEKKASHDGLTGLLNHTSAMSLILQKIQQNPKQRFALAVFDLDKFKSVNDTYGHTCGNEVLQYVAGKLKKNIRSGDIAARIGGDEFLVFLRYESKIETAVRRIFDVLVGEYEKIPISVSMGVALTDAVGREYAALFRAADQALYYAKRAGRGQFVFYNDTMRETLSPCMTNEEER